MNIFNRKPKIEATLPHSEETRSDELVNPFKQIGAKAKEDEEQKLAEADRAAQERYPIGSPVRVKENGHWGKVVGYVTQMTYGMKQRTEPFVIVGDNSRPQTTQDYPLGAIEPWSDSKK